MSLLITLLALAAPSVDVELSVKKPLALSRRGELQGALEVRVTNRGAQPVTLRHRDVHGLRFVRADGDGGVEVVFHVCDCGFELGLEAPPTSRTWTLGPGERRALTFDDFTCGGGPFRPPPPGRYQLSFSMSEAPPSPPEPAPGPRLDLDRCQAQLRSRPPEAFQSRPVAVRLRR